MQINIQVQRKWCLKINSQIAFTKLLKDVFVSPEQIIKLGKKIPVLYKFGKHELFKSKITLHTVRIRHRQ